jgi:hypothetical protein
MLQTFQVLNFKLKVNSNLTKPRQIFGLMCHDECYIFAAPLKTALFRSWGLKTPFFRSGLASIPAFKKSISQKKATKN